MPQKNNALLTLFQNNFYDMVKSQTVAEVLPAIQKIQEAYQNIQNDAEHKDAVDGKMFEASLSLIGQTALSRDPEMLQSNYIAMQSQMVPVMEYAMQAPEKAAHLKQVMARAERDLGYRQNALKGSHPEMSEMLSCVADTYAKHGRVLGNYLNQKAPKRALHANLFRKP